MSEFFLELFSEEIPAGLQKNLGENLLKSFNDFFEEKSIPFKRSSSYSTPNRLVILFEGVQRQITQKNFFVNDIYILRESVSTTTNPNKLSQN